MVMRQFDCRRIVIVDDRCWLFVAEFFEERAEPDYIFGCVADSEVLSLHGRECDNALQLRFP